MEKHARLSGRSESILNIIVNIILLLLAIFCAGFIITINVFKLFNLIIEILLKHLIIKKKNKRVCPKCKHVYNSKRHTIFPKHLHEINNNHLNWIPFKQVEQIEFIAKGGFNRVFKAQWNDN